MTNTVDRRTVLKGAAAAAAVSAIGENAAAAPDGLTFGDPSAFSFDLFKARAREKAHGPYAPPPQPAPEVVQKINYEEWGKIRFRPDHALFANGPGRFPVTFFHLGLFFQKAVDMYAVENGQAREGRLRSILFRHARRFGCAWAAAGRRFRRPAHPGSARRRARLAQERLGRLSRRRIFPRHRRAASIRPVGARRRARRRGRRPRGGIPQLHAILRRTRRRATTR